MKRITFLLCFFIYSSSPSFALDINDYTRNRIIPLEFYKSSVNPKLPVVIINHGYSVKNTEYTFIANELANRGYFVVSIQHDLETDKPLPREGDLFKLRKPFWERGVKNILFVIEELQKKESSLDLSKVILIGHSNGGDISMMFASLYPEKVSKIVSLDSLRYPFPANIPILHFGASDTKPDVGVVPTIGVKTILITNAKHMDFCDRGIYDVKNEVVKSIIEFLGLS